MIGEQFLLHPRKKVLIFLFAGKKTFQQQVKEKRLAFGHFKKMESSAGFLFAFLPVQATKKQVFFFSDKLQQQSEKKKCHAVAPKKLCFLREKRLGSDFFFFLSKLHENFCWGKNKTKKASFRNASFLFLVQSSLRIFVVEKAKKKKQTKKQFNSSTS